jgi:hypothetical protein
MLKFIEICHNLNRQKYLEEEKKLVQTKLKLTSRIRRFLGVSKNNGNSSTSSLSTEEIVDLKYQGNICEEIFDIFQNSIEIMDEVDILLHPLKSELNWPLGLKEPLDFTRSRLGQGLRWNIPSHLLDALFGCCGVAIIADIAESKQARTFLSILWMSCYSVGFSSKVCTLAEFKYIFSFSRRL